MGSQSPQCPLGLLILSDLTTTTIKRQYERENTMTASKTIDPAELIATTLLASFSLEKIPFRAIAKTAENTGVKASQIVEHLERVRLETEPQIHQ